jgi:hypothetical protein
MAGAYKIEEEIASYACKMCRMKLFTSENLLEHEPQQHQIAARKVNVNLLFIYTIYIDNLFFDRKLKTLNKKDINLLFKNFVPLIS